ncbi:MAG: hypothetical protein ABGW84_02905 [Sphingomonadaceae bacterium]
MNENNLHKAFLCPKALACQSIYDSCSRKPKLFWYISITSETNYKYHEFLSIPAHIIRSISMGRISVDGLCEGVLMAPAGVIAMVPEQGLLETDWADCLHSSFIGLKFEEN